jgi:shikimate kinase
MKSNIALIGFMGAGKTAVGKLLAEKLGKQFIELDELIEKRTGKTIPEIFRQDGEIAFREIEIEVTRDAAEETNAVIACGGGIVMNQINIERLKKNSVIVYLETSPEMVLKRTSSDKDERPMLIAEDKTAEVKRLLKLRQPFYERSADMAVNTSVPDVAGVTGQIIKKLSRL